jgi:hypothetical protein
MLCVGINPAPLQRCVTQERHWLRYHAERGNEIMELLILFNSFRVFRAFRGQPPNQS